MEKVVIDLFGWTGAFLLLFGYYLVSQNRVSGNSKRYQILNAVAAMMLLGNSFYYGAFPSVAVNVLWICVAGYTLLGRKRE